MHNSTMMLDNDHARFFLPAQVNEGKETTATLCDATSMGKPDVPTCVQGAHSGRPSRRHDGS